MSDTSIEWTDKTWNPVRGCALVSPGCTNCYAMKFAHRFSGEGGRYDGLTRNREQGGPVWVGSARPVPEMLTEPLKWRKPQKVFVNSMSDLFHEDVPDEFIDAVFAVMAFTPHTYQVLTKRPERAARWYQGARLRIEAVAGDLFLAGHLKTAPGRLAWWPLPNVWIGVSVEDQQRADERIPHLLRVPAAVRFLSCEPLLGPVRDRFNQSPRWSWADVGWVIVGGESGPGARPFDLAWARSIVAQCRAAGVACFVKQLGAVPIPAKNGDGSGHDDMNGRRIRMWQSTTNLAQRLALDFADRKGGDMEEWPEDLRVREWPVTP